MQKKVQKKFLVFEITASEWVTLIMSLLGKEHLATALMVLTNSFNLWLITKRDFLQLNFLPVEQ